MKTKEPNTNMKGRNSSLLWIIGIVLAIVIFAAAFFIFNSSNSPQTLPTLVATNTNSPIETSSSSSATAAIDITATTASNITTNTPEVILAATTSPATPTDIIVTQNPQEMSLQDQAEASILGLEPVDAIITLDIDLADGQAPLVYIELVLHSGYNNVQTVNLIKEQLNILLNTTTYSDFMLIASDGVKAVEFIYDSTTGNWSENQLLSTTPATPQNP